MNKTVQYITHEYPVWRKQADFIIHAKIETNDNILRLEQLWARRISGSENNFEICCIPFFLYNLSLGDKVKTDMKYGKKYVFTKVVEPSGHYTFRIWFNDNKLRSEILNELIEIGCLVERQSPTGNLIALDIHSFDGATKLAEYLLGKEQQGVLIYETGRQ